MSNRPMKRTILLMIVWSLLFLDEKRTGRVRSSSGEAKPGWSHKSGGPGRQPSFCMLLLVMMPSVVETVRAAQANRCMLQ
jgi:hypothetical protein